MKVEANESEKKLETEVICVWYKEAREANLDDLYDGDLPLIATGDIEAVLERHTFNIDDFKGGSRSMEGARSIPLMSVAFQRSLVENDNIPSPHKYMNKYESTNKDFVDELDDDEVKGMRYRVMRAYPSLVRDVHFVCLAREMGAEVHRTLRDDINGIDATISTSDGPRMIRLYYDSPRSRRYRISKAMVHTVSKKHIDVPLKQDQVHKVGNIFLYPSDFISNLLDEIGAIDVATK